MSARSTALLVIAIVLGVGGCGGGPPAAAPSTAAGASSSEPSSPSPEPPATPSASADVAQRCTLATTAFDAADLDLTGLWAGDDGGVYYLRQLEKVVWWNGMSGRNGPSNALGREWNNVARGEIADDLTIAVDWADVPRGDILGMGTLMLKVGPDAAGVITITKTSETGRGFGNSVWTPCAPT